MSDCRGKLDFEKNKIGRVEGPDLIRGAEHGINPQQITRKRKNDKRGTPPKIVHKVPNLSGAVPRFSTGCTSIQSCSQSAIEFSQQQMNDFECLAVKLTKELKSMKEILEERLLPEACPASSFKYNVDRVSYYTIWKSLFTFLWVKRHGMPAWVLKPKCFFFFFFKIFRMPQFW